MTEKLYKLPRCIDCALCCNEDWAVSVRPYDKYFSLGNGEYVENTDANVPTDKIFLAAGRDEGNMLSKSKYAGGGCIALKGKLCIIYNDRPMVCKAFKRGGAQCLSLLDGTKKLRDNEYNREVRNAIRRLDYKLIKDYLLTLHAPQQHNGYP